MSNWASSFLKIGYNAGIWANKAQYGIPLLKVQNLKPKIQFPPIYKIKYNQFSHNNDFNKDKYFRTLNNYRSDDENSIKSRRSSLNKNYKTDYKLNNIERGFNIKEKNKTINYSKDI